MLAITIKDLEIYFSNTNLILGNNAISFEPLTQKRKVSKQIADVLY